MSERTSTEWACFDPFRCLPFGKRALRKLNPWWCVGLLGLFLLIAVVIAALEETLGTTADFQLVADVERLISPETAPASKPAFPLLRDVPSFLLIVVVATTAGIVLRQWQLMYRCIPDLLTTPEPPDPESPSLQPIDRPPVKEAREHLDQVRQESTNHEDMPILKARSNAKYRTIHRLLLLDRLLKRRGDGKPLYQLLAAINDGLFEYTARGAIVIVPLAVLLTVLLMLGEMEGVFSVIAPPSLQSRELTEWTTQTYQSWWAGLSHPAGAIAYGFITVVGLTIILYQNIVGLAAVYLILSLSAVAELNVDWVSADSSAGWEPFARVYQTVRWSLFVHGLGLSVIIIIVGVDIGWVAALVAIWIVGLVFYLVYPYYLFWRVAVRAKRSRTLAIASAVRAANSRNPRALNRLELEAWASNAIEHARKHKLNLLHTRRWELTTIWIGVLLPVALAVGQTFFVGGFGSN